LKVYFIFVLGFFSCASITHTSLTQTQCENSPENMICISEGSFVSPSSGQTIQVDNFYIDQVKITQADYLACVKEKGCKQNSKSSFQEAQLPAFPLTFEMAYDYCKWRGKRLPFEVEWEKAYSKLRDIEGNVFEWVNDWAEECKECSSPSCSQVCLKEVPICSGRFPCKNLKRKIVKGGGLSKESVKPEFRKIVPIQGDDSLIGARCASDTPYLTFAPAWMIKNPPPTPEIILPEPSKAQVEIAHKLEAYDTLDKPFCNKPFTSLAHCRDPVSYIKTNEASNFLFAPYIKNLRGGYVGIAADTNYTFISYAKSEWVFLMDFDYVILSLNRIIRAFVKESPTVKDFLEKWNPINSKSSLAILEKYYSHTEDLPTIKTIFLKNQAQLYNHYKTSSLPDKTFQDFGWLRHEPNYAYIRQLYLQERISIHGGDLLKDKTLYSIGQASKKLGIKIRVYYPSNAEEFWDFNENYKRNVLNLPFDEASVVIRTIHEFPWHIHDRTGGVRGFWHYVVHGAYNYQKKLQYPDYFHIEHFKNERIIPTDRVDFSTIHLPASIPDFIYGKK